MEGHCWTYFIAQPNIYRKDYFNEVGADKFPDDYLSLLDASRKLKANGHPCGQADVELQRRQPQLAVGAVFVRRHGDSPGWQDHHARFSRDAGGAQVRRELFNNGMTDEVFSWDDSGNNLLMLSGRGSWIDNATSVYITAVNQSRTSPRIRTSR